MMIIFDTEPTVIRVAAAIVYFALLPLAAVFYLASQINRRIPNLEPAMNVLARTVRS